MQPRFVYPEINQDILINIPPFHCGIGQARAFPSDSYTAACYAQSQLQGCAARADKHASHITTELPLAWLLIKPAAPIRDYKDQSVTIHQPGGYHCCTFQVWWPSGWAYGVIGHGAGTRHPLHLGRHVEWRVSQRQEAGTETDAGMPVPLHGKFSMYMYSGKVAFLRLQST